MAESLRVNFGSESAILLQQGPVDPKFQVEGVVPTNHSSSWKTRLRLLSYDIKIRTHPSFVLPQITHLTDGQTEFSSLDRVCILCSVTNTTALSSYVFCQKNTAICSLGHGLCTLTAVHGLTETLCTLSGIMVK